MSNGNMSDFWSDVQRSLTRLFSTPTLIITIAMVFFIHFSHLDDFASGPLGTLAANYPNSTAVRFLILEFDKLLGVSVVLPMLYEIKANIFVMLVVAAVVLVSPPLAIYVYAILGIGFCLMTTARHPVSRMMIFVMIILSMFFGVLDFKQHIVTATSNSTFVCPAGYTERLDLLRLHPCTKNCVKGIYLTVVYQAVKTACRVAVLNGTCNSVGLCI